MSLIAALAPMILHFYCIKKKSEKLSSPQIYKSRWGYKRKKTLCKFISLLWVYIFYIYFEMFWLCTTELITIQSKLKLLATSAIILCVLQVAVPVLITPSEQCKGVNVHALKNMRSNFFTAKLLLHVHQNHTSWFVRVHALILV